METKKRKKITNRRTRSVRKICFVVCPIGKKGSIVRRRADTVLKSIIRPALDMRNVKYLVQRIDTRQITELVIESLLRAELVIADITDLNPNVMYEIGIRQAWDRPLILMAHEHEGELLPFDLKGVNVIFYSTKTKKSVTFAQRQIRRSVRGILRGERDRVFEQALRTVIRGYQSLDILRALIDSLDDLYKSLWKIKKDFRYVVTLKDGRFMFELSSDLREVFNIFSHKIHVFEQISFNSPYEAYGNEKIITVLIDKCLELPSRAVELDIRLTNMSITKKNVEITSRKLDKVMKEIKSLAMSVRSELMR